MRIAIVSPFFPPSIGGVESIAENAAVELARRGYEVHVITTSYNNMWEKIADFGSCPRDGIRVHRLKTLSVRAKYATIMKNLTGVLSCLRPDIIHVHCLHPHLYQSISVKRKIKSRLVAQLHAPWASGPEGVLPKLLFPLAFSVMRKMQKYVDMFVTHDTDAARYLVEHGINGSRVSIVKQPTIPRAVLEFKPTEVFEDDTILYLGRITWKKGLHVLVQAAPLILRELDDANIVIAGPAERTYYERLIALAKKLDVMHGIRFIPGAVKEPEKFNFMASAAVFVTPSVKDLHPITLLEAQALGTPVVATDVGSVRNIVLSNKTGILVKPNKVDELARAIIDLLSNKSLRHTMGLEAKRFVADNYVLDKAVDELEKIYDRITFKTE